MGTPSKEAQPCQVRLKFSEGPHRCAAFVELLELAAEVVSAFSGLSIGIPGPV